MAAPLGLLGVHHVTLPVSDIARSRAWYADALQLQPTIDEESEDSIIAVTLEDAAGRLGLRLRYAPERAHALSGFALLCLAVPSSSELARWDAHFGSLGIERTPIRPAHLGWLLTIADPDGIQVELHTRELISAEFE